MANPEILTGDVSATKMEAELGSVKAHFKEEIKDLSDEMREKLAAKYEQRVKLIKEKYKDKADVPIQGSKDKFAKLLAQIKEEHADKNEDDDTKTDDDKTEKKLSEKEIDAALATFEKDMSPASPETPAVTPKKPEGPEAKALELAKAHFALGEGDEIKAPSKVPFNFGMAIQKWIKDIIISIKKAFGADVSDDLAQLEGYSGSEMKQKSEIVFSALSPYMGPSVETLRDPKGEPKTKEESLVKLIEGAGIPIKYAKSCIKYVFTGDKEILGKLPTSIKKETLMALRGNYIVKSETNDTGTLAEKSPRQKLDNIFQIEPGKTQEYIERAKLKELEDEALAHPPITQDTTKPEPEQPRETVNLDEVISQYQGKKYGESADEKGVQLKKQGDKIIIDKGTVHTEVNVNADGQLEYRSISGTPEDIMQLMIMDTYIQSLPGDASSITLADKNILNGKNSITKGAFELKEIPSFAKNWNWQDLYNFVSGKEMAPAEREKMSGKEPTPISQVDLDAILARTTDTAKNGATLTGEIDSETHEITITRTDADGKVSKESIFPLKGGKNFMVGNVTFPIFADAIKASNMRNWVSWHAQNGHELHRDGYGDEDIEVSDGWFNDSSLIQNGVIPEFLQRGVSMAGEKLDTTAKVFDFLNGVTKKDGDFGTDKARTAWKSAKTPE